MDKMSDDRCICCGAYIPEGRRVCYLCSGDIRQDISVEEAEILIYLASAPDKDISKIMR